MILTDTTLRKEIADGRLQIDPFTEANIQPSSIDLILGNQFRVFKNIHKAYLDVKEPVDEMMELVTIPEGEPAVIHPGEFVLGTTVERIGIPADMVGILEGRSSLGRIGIIVHSTAGYFDPGWDGEATLEISNLGRVPVRLYPGMRIAQMVFYRATEPATVPYGSEKSNNKYKRQVGPTVSRVHEDFGE